MCHGQVKMIYIGAPYNTGNEFIYPDTLRETLRGMMGLKPEQILCLDQAFHGDDLLKTNTVLEMKSHEIIVHTA